MQRIKANAAGFATLMIADPRGRVVVDRTGQITIHYPFHTGDFDFPHASAGFARFQSGGAHGKPGTCGYFDGTTLHITIAPTFDHCMAAASGSATVCIDCASYCTEPECHSRTFIGGQGLVIDRHNTILRRFTPPPITQACGGDAGRLVKRENGSAYLECPAPGADIQQTAIGETPRAG